MASTVRVSLSSTFFQKKNWIGNLSTKKLTLEALLSQHNFFQIYAKCLFTSISLLLTIHARPKVTILELVQNTSFQKIIFPSIIAEPSKLGANI